MHFPATLTRSPSGFNGLAFFPANWRPAPLGGSTDHLTPPVRCDYIDSSSNRMAPSSSLAQDTCLSRMQHGFESRRGHLPIDRLSPQRPALIIEADVHSSSEFRCHLSSVPGVVKIAFAPVKSDPVRR